MKKLFISAILSIALCSIFSCNNNRRSEPGTHTHDDGSTHADHDTIKPKQEEFILPDSTNHDSTTEKHTHKDDETHSH